MKVLTNYDFNGNEIQNVSLQKLASAPTNPVKGQPYFNTTDNRAYTWDGSKWKGMDADDAAMTGTEIAAAINGSSAVIDDDNLSAGMQAAEAAAHTHSNKSALDATTAAFLAADRTKLDGIAAGANNYVHPTGDGNHHVPATGTANSGKVLTAGSTAGSEAWQTPSVAWGGVSGAPSSSPSAIDSAVANSHTHANKALLDTYNQTNANLADAVTKKHAQNTDTGTSSATFAVGSTGVKLKNNGGTELQVRNNADTDFADLHVKNLTVDGATTVLNSTEVDIGDNEIMLNSDIANHTANSDGGIAVKRLASDDSTRKDAELKYNNSTGKWQTTGGDVSGALVTAQIANKVTAVVGDGSSTAITVTHNLNTRELSVSIHESASPYAMVMTDVEFTTLNTITLKFAVAPASGQYTVTVIG